MSLRLKKSSLCVLALASLMTLFSTFGFAATATMYPQPGRFVGYIQMKKSPVKIPVSFDAIRVPTASGQADLVVVMKLTFGGFDGHEYVTQNYKIANYDWSAPEITLDANEGGNGPDISLTNGLVSSDGQSIEGKIHTAKGGAITGAIKLVRKGEKADTELALAQIFPGAQVIPSITGEYFGECDGHKSILQLEATRKSDMVSDTGNPFEGFDVHGRYGIRNDNIFNSGGFRYMLIQAFDDTEFNFYQPAIHMPSLARTCKITANGLDCSRDGGFDSCVLHKAESRTSLGALDKPMTPVVPQTLDALPAMSPPVDGLQMPWPTTDETLAGSYSGYIYVDQRKAFERMSIELSLSGAPGTHLSGASRLNLSALAKIYFGDSDVLHGQSLYFKFQPLKLPDQKPESLTFVGVTDPIMHITEWDGETIGGIWYSRSHGYGGRFRLARHPSGQKDVSLLPPAEIPFAESLQGSYKTKDSKGLFNYDKIVLQVLRKQSAGASATYPFRLRGTYIRSRSYKSKTTPGGVNYARQVATIVDGSFDSFTGVLSMKLNNGVSVIGKVTEEGLDLHFSGEDNQFHGGIHEHYLSTFIKQNNEADPGNVF